MNMDQNGCPGPPLASQVHRVGGAAEGNPLDILVRAGSSPSEREFI